MNSKKEKSNCLLKQEIIIITWWQIAGWLLSEISLVWPINLCEEKTVK